MKFDWSEYLKLAQELIESETNEAKQRSAISRAYYAVFCYARNYLKDYLDFQSRRGENEHQTVAEEFKTYDSQNRKMREIGNDLSRLRLDRNKADYEDVFIGLGSKAKFALKLATSIIDKINELIKEKSL
ncbi:MAG: HEPN domain-containing protein [Cyanobacterium sp. T60_A2020_053]|nr:HEPN domain-containing protein [Cyanobacterium sp. T60_A2020_053]